MVEGHFSFDLRICRYILTCSEGLLLQLTLRRLAGPTWRLSLPVGQYIGGHHAIPSMVQYSRLLLEMKAEVVCYSRSGGGYPSKSPHPSVL